MILTILTRTLQREARARRALLGQRSRVVIWWGGAALLAACAVLVARSVDTGALANTWHSAVGDPAGVALALVAYACAFVLRAGAWTLVLPRLRFAHALSAIHVSLAGNHLLPLRLGEALRITSVTRRTPVPFAAAAASTVALRASDVLAVLLLAVLLAPAVLEDVMGTWRFAFLGVCSALLGAGLWLLRRGERRSAGTEWRPRILALALGAGLTAWLLETVVVWEAAGWAGIELSYGEAAAVTAVTIAAQTVAITPGGLGTYEAAAAAAFVAFGATAGPALAAALAAHALKTAYALITGAAALFLPAPGLAGRIRLERHRAPRRTGSAVQDPDAPVILFLPAHDEEETVGGVVRRAPSSVCGHPLVVLVIDDGSTDATAEKARAAGAHVISIHPNRGLGAAVRRGLAEATARSPAAVAFCDADGEYAPEQLERLVEQILDGRADYVVGSRFAGEIRRMRPHRRLGNVVLTRMLGFVARTPLTDGQSGYRALSAEAAAAAEIIHDFNYAQVLTLDLLAKGFRYAEVPIGYGFRTTGKSFVRLGRYLRHVVPAVHRELNQPNLLADPDANAA